MKAGVGRNVRAQCYFENGTASVPRTSIDRVGWSNVVKSFRCVNMLHVLTRFCWQCNWARINVGIRNRRTLRPRMTISTPSNEARRILQEAISASPVEYLDLALGAT